MDKKELQALIEKGIKGQGTNVDGGGILGKVLENIVEGAEFGKEAKLTVKIFGYKKNEDETEFESFAGAEGIAIVKGFTRTLETLPVDEIPFTLNEEGKAEIEIPANVGDTIGVVAKIARHGASCQIVTMVVGESTIALEVYPAGLYEMGDAALGMNPGSDMYNGTVIVTEDFACLFPPTQREDNGEYQFGGIMQKIPFVMKAADSAEAIKDFDGALNTAAILSVVQQGNCAAKVATESGGANYTRFNPFLPSMGILKYLYDHRTEINGFITEEENEYSEEYAKIPTNQALWSSTDADETDSGAVLSWHLNFNGGGMYHNYRSHDGGVAAVSAFSTLF